MNFCDKSANSQNILVVQSSVVLLLLVVCESVHSLLNALTNRVLLNNIELKCAVLLFFVTAGYCIVLYCIVLYSFQASSRKLWQVQCIHGFLLETHIQCEWTATMRSCPAGFWSRSSWNILLSIFRCCSYSDCLFDLIHRWQLFIIS